MFAKSVIVFKIALTIVVIGFNISQDNSKSPILDEPFLLKLSSLYLLINYIPKCYLCLFTGYIHTNYPFKETF